MNRLSQPRIVRFIPGIIWFTIVLVLMCLPGSKVPRIKLFAELLLDKIVHFGCFALLVVLWGLPFIRTNRQRVQKLSVFNWLLIAGIVWGLATELIQRYFIPGRSYDLFDWLADALGAFGGWLALRWWLAKSSKKQV